MTAANAQQGTPVADAKKNKTTTKKVKGTEAKVNQEAANNIADILEDNDVDLGSNPRVTIIVEEDIRYMDPEPSDSRFERVLQWAGKQRGWRGFFVKSGAAALVALSGAGAYGAGKSVRNRFRGDEMDEIGEEI